MDENLEDPDADAQRSMYQGVGSCHDLYIVQVPATGSPVEEGASANSEGAGATGAGDSNRRGGLVLERQASSILAATTAAAATMMMTMPSLPKTSSFMRGKGLGGDGGGSSVDVQFGLSPSSGDSMYAGGSGSGTSNATNPMAMAITARSDNSSRGSSGSSSSSGSFRIGVGIGVGGGANSMGRSQTGEHCYDDPLLVTDLRAVRDEMMMALQTVHVLHKVPAGKVSYRYAWRMARGA